MMARNAQFRGITLEDGHRVVMYDGAPLALVLWAAVERQQPVQWGYPGPGSTILARSMLAAVIGELQAAGALAAEYASHFTDRISVDHWIMDASEVLAWVEAHPAGAKWLGRN